MGHGPPEDKYPDIMPEPALLRGIRSMYEVLFKRPTYWIKDNIVTPNQQEYYWYHRKYKRVPTVDQCLTTDLVCVWEAQQQMNRDKKIEEKTITILQRRFEECVHKNMDNRETCKPLSDIWQAARTALFVKYGDLGPKPRVEQVYMKQKHRLIWERRYGDVGTGMNPKPQPEKKKKKETEPAC